MLSPGQDDVGSNVGLFSESTGSSTAINRVRPTQQNVNAIDDSCAPAINCLPATDEQIDDSQQNVNAIDDSCAPAINCLPATDEQIDDRQRRPNFNAVDDINVSPAADIGL